MISLSVASSTCVQRYQMEDSVNEQPISFSFCSFLSRVTKSQTTLLLPRWDTNSPFVQFMFWSLHSCLGHQISHLDVTMLGVSDVRLVL